MEITDLIIGIVGGLIGYVLSFLTLRFNYKQLFAETVSKNRMEWINVWRENISKFLACAEVLHLGVDNSDKNKYLYDFYEARTMITSRLNMTEDLHKLMFAAINQLDYSQNNAEFAQQREYILELARAILKPEWERVKQEAKGKK